MDDWGQIITVFLYSTFKYIFFGGVPLALYFGFSFFKTVVVCTSGGTFGSFIFVNFFEWLIRKWKNGKIKRSSFSKKKKFTRTNKLIITVKRRFGLAGIAIIGPLLLSIPLGCFVAVRYFKNKTKIMLYMFASVFLWSVLIASYKLFLK